MKRESSVPERVPIGTRMLRYVASIGDVGAFDGEHVLRVFASEEREDKGDVESPQAAKDEAGYKMRPQPLEGDTPRFHLFHHGRTYRPVQCPSKPVCHADF